MTPAYCPKHFRVNTGLDSQQGQIQMLPWPTLGQQAQQQQRLVTLQRAHSSVGRPKSADASILFARTSLVISVPAVTSAVHERHVDRRPSALTVHGASRACSSSANQPATKAAATLQRTKGSSRSRPAKAVASPTSSRLSTPATTPNLANPHASRPATGNPYLANPRPRDPAATIPSPATS
jgi:hypothetical protein